MRAVGEEQVFADGGALLFQLGVGRRMEGGEPGEEVLDAALVAVLVEQQRQEEEEEDYYGWEKLAREWAGQNKLENGGHGDIPTRPPTIAGMELECEPPALSVPPSAFLLASEESPFPTVPLPYEVSSLPVSPPQLVEVTPLLVKALEVVAVGVFPVAGVGFDPCCVVAATWELSATPGPGPDTAPAVGRGSALCPWTAGGEFANPGEAAPLPAALPPPLVLACVGVLLPPASTTLVGVPPAAPPPLVDPGPEPAVAAAPDGVVGAAPGVVAGLAGAAADDVVALFPLPLPFPLPFPLPLLPLPFATPFTLALLPFPFPLPFALSLPLPLLARRSTACAAGPGPSSSRDAAALGTRSYAGLLSASASSSRLSRALSLSGPSGGRRIFAARSQAVGNKRWRVRRSKLGDIRRRCMLNWPVQGASQGDKCCERENV